MAQLVTVSRMTSRRKDKALPQVHKTALGQEDDVTTASHSVSVDLGFNVDGLLGVSLEPCDVDFDIEVTDAG